MIPEPRISVIVPAYRHERFVGDALASLRAQTLQRFEVVVVDDGSPDGTAEIAQAVARDDARFRVLRQANAGSHAAINRGVAEASGDWIAILNSDDRFAETRLARLRDEALAGAQFVVTATRLIDEHGAQITDRNHWWLKTVGRFHRKALELGIFNAWTAKMREALGRLNTEMYPPLSEVESIVVGRRRASALRRATCGRYAASITKPATR